MVCSPMHWHTQNTEMVACVAYYHRGTQAPCVALYIEAPWIHTTRGALRSSARPQPPRRGRGSGEGGGSFFSILEAFLTSPFHFEHFASTQMR